MTFAEHIEKARVQWACAVLVALAAVAITDAFTGTIPRPLFDGWFYSDMAANGIAGNPRLVAPFAYRPAGPLIAGFIAELFSVPVPTAFGILARLAAVTTLLLVFGFARSFGAGFRGSLAAETAIAFSCFQLKFPLYFPMLVDVVSYPLVLLAVWALLRRMFVECLLLSCAGMFFKEFLVIPALLVSWCLGSAYRRDRSWRTLLSLGCALALTAVCVAAPRIFIPVVGSRQFIDPIRDPASLSKLMTVPLDWRRDVNLAFSSISYWLPTLLLVTSARLGKLWNAMEAERGLLLAYAGGVLILALYGGTNLMVFVTYTLPVQAIALSRLASGGDVDTREIAFMLAAVLVFNRILLAFPVLTPDDPALFRFVDFYGGWSSRITTSTALRSLELVGYLVLAVALRRFAWQRARLLARRASGSG